MIINIFAVIGLLAVIGAIFYVFKMFNPGPAPKKNDISKYHKHRPELKTGDVIAFQGHDFGAGVIRLGEKLENKKGKYSHVGLVVRINDVAHNKDRVFLAESVTSSGVVLLPLSRKLEYYKGNAWWFKLNEDKDDTHNIHETIYGWAMMELGKAYDFKLIGSIATHILFKCVLPPTDKQGFICSEFVAAAFKKAKLLEGSIELTRNNSQKYQG